MWILVVPLHIVIGTIGGIICLICGKWLIGFFILLSTFALNWATETIPLRCKRKSVVQGSSLRVLNYNINNCHYFEEDTINRVEAFISFIKQQDLDVLCLEEVASIVRLGIDERLREVFPYASGRYDVYSRYPIHDHHQLLIGQNDDLLFRKLVGPHWEEMPIYSMTLDFDGLEIRLIDCYLMTNNFNRVKYDLAKESCWKRIILTPLLVFRYLVFGYHARSKGARLIAEEIEKNEMPTMVVGDFNDLSGSSALRTIQQSGLADAWWTGGWGLGFTFCSQGMLWRLDHILFSKHFRIEFVQVIKACFSDHRPLLVTLIVPEIGLRDSSKRGF